MIWLCCLTGSVPVWNDFYLGRPNDKQINTLYNLKENGLFLGRLCEIRGEQMRVFELRLYDSFKKNEYVVMGKMVLLNSGNPIFTQVVKMNELLNFNSKYVSSDCLGMIQNFLDIVTAKTKSVNNSQVLAYMKISNMRWRSLLAMEFVEVESESVCNMIST